MLGLIFYGLTAPLYYGAKAVSSAARSSRRYQPRGPRYSHGYCTIAHRSPGAAQRCAMSAQYRRFAAAERLRLAQIQAQREEEARIRAARRWARKQTRKQQWAKVKRAVSGNPLWSVVLGIAAIVVILLIAALLISVILGARPTSGTAYPSPAPTTVPVTATPASPPPGAGAPAPAGSGGTHYVPVPHGDGYCETCRLVPHPHVHIVPHPHVHL